MLLCNRKIIFDYFCYRYCSASMLKNTSFVFINIKSYSKIWLCLRNQCKADTLLNRTKIPSLARTMGFFFFLSLTPESFLSTERKLSGYCSLGILHRYLNYIYTLRRSRGDNRNTDRRSTFSLSRSHQFSIKGINLHLI